MHPTKILLFWLLACVCHQAKPSPNKALAMTPSIGCDVASICSFKSNCLLSKFALHGSKFEASKRHQNASEIPTRQMFIEHHRKDKQTQYKRKRHPLASRFHKQASGFRLRLKCGHNSVRAPPPPPSLRTCRHPRPMEHVKTCMRTHKKHSNCPKTH